MMQQKTNMDMRVKELNVEPVLGGAKISFVTDETSQLNNLLSMAEKKPLKAEFKPYRNKRSVDANSYMWVLCDKIAETIHSTKEEVYRKAIRDVGVYTDVAIQNKAVKYLIETWTSRGIGWITDTFDSKLEDCKRVRLYKGSHLYDTKQMSRLIDYIVDEAKELGIETLTPEELERMTERAEDGASF